MSGPGTPLPRGGIQAAFADTDDLLVEKQRWNQLAAMRAVIGQCRACGGDLLAVPPSEHDAQGEDDEITWYEASCAQCGKEYAAPNGRVFRRSTSHRETPRDWLSARERRDAEQRRAMSSIKTADRAHRQTY